MRRLKNLDKVAYVRFASVYLEFEDVSAFMTELKLWWIPVTKQPPTLSTKRKRRNSLTLSIP